MNEMNNLKYFLNSIKQTLPFKDETDFKKKIIESKNFRIRVQKLVYLSKFFGWDNTYHFNFHENGPYSYQLSKDYHNITSFNEFNEEIMIKKSFANFVNEDNDFLEASTTILYYLNQIPHKTIEKEKIITILKYLKPHIPKNTIEKAYNTLINYELLNHKLSQSKIKLEKEIVIDKLDGLISVFKSFEICSNQFLLLGSLDYLRLALKREKLQTQKKNELLKTVYDYGEYIENFYFNNYSFKDNFPYFDLTEIDERFIALQDYISNLGILPHLYDENVDLRIFCE